MRRAVLKIAPELAAEFFKIVDAECIDVLQTLPSEIPRCDLIFIIAGVVLPEKCESPLPLQIVEMTFWKETYGKQSIVKLENIKLVGLYERDWFWRREIPRAA